MDGSLRYISDTVIVLAFGWTERIAYEPSFRRRLSIMTLVERCRGFCCSMYLLTVERAIEQVIAFDDSFPQMLTWFSFAVHSSLLLLLRTASSLGWLNNL